MESSRKKFANKKNLTNSLQQQAAEYLAGWKRCKADFENYKKKQQDWEKSVRLYATEDIILKIIPVIDNFELSINHIPQIEENKSWKEGISHVKKQLEDVLTSFGVTQIKVQPGDLFDPVIHECVAPISKENSSNQKNNIILKEIIRSGYQLGDKVLRPAQVTVQ